MSARERLLAYGLKAPELLLPQQPESFAVIACDQHSAEPEYWERVEQIVGDRPSALRLITPEAWLETPREPEPEVLANAAKSYLASGELAPAFEGFMYVERETHSGTRAGLIAALDLERYSYKPGEHALIRSTEHTVAERLPPRAAIRALMPVELPHIMVLVDDPEDLLLGSLRRERGGFQKQYDFELMLGGGRAAGWRVPEQAEAQIANAIERLYAAAIDGFVFAMGDGNHSLAAAKQHWENLKPGLSPSELEQHPARFCLVEINNLYDPAIRFLPIHRLVIGSGGRELPFDPQNPPDISIAQPLLDEWLAHNPDARLEYIHGETTCRELGNKPGNTAIIFGEFDKASLFRTVRENGELQRKSFSIGNPEEKRYYLEARKII